MAKASDNVFPRLLISEGGSTTTPASGNVTVYAKADGLLYSKDDAGTETLVSGGSGGAGGTTVTISRKTADESFSTTTANNSTGMALAIGASKNYRFRFVVFFTTNASSVSISLGIMVPASATVRYGAYVPLAAPSGAGGALLQVAVGSTGVGAVVGSTGPGASAQMAIVEGVVVNSTNAGDIQLLHASETATATTILANSYGELIEIA